MAGGATDAEASEILGVTPEDWIEVLTQPSTDILTAGRFEGTSRNTTYKRRESGELPSFRAGAQWRIPTEFLLQRAGLVTPEARAAALSRARDEIRLKKSGRLGTIEPRAAA